MPLNDTSSNNALAQLLGRRQLVPQLVLDGMVTRAQALQEWLGKVAVEDNILSYNELAQAIAAELSMPMISLNINPPAGNVLTKIPPETCRSHGVIPIGFAQNALVVAMANPLDEAGKKTLTSLTNTDLSIRIAPLDVILAAIDTWYPKSGEPSAPKLDAPAPSVLLSNYNARLGKQDTDEIPFPEVKQDDYSLDDMLIAMLQQNASDLHLAVGSAPMCRVDGELRALPFPMLKPAIIQEMVYAILTDVQITAFERNWELDCAYSIPGLSRFRVNVHRQRGSVGAVLRVIPTETPTLDKLKMPRIVLEMTARPRGLVLVTGPTGSGKSTTLAAMIDEINRTRRCHIITIEDPIEFLHNNKMSVVTQREVGADTESFSAALRHAMRQDPDVILVGEMRDLETISTAVTAAETGHLVFATLHTTSAAQTIDRIIDVFPPHQQEQIRSQLSTVLEGVLTQTLCINVDGKGRSCAQEILVCTPAVRNLIREGKVHQLPSVLQASGKYGMQTLDHALIQLVHQRKISLDEALLKAANPEDFKSLVSAK